MIDYLTNAVDIVIGNFYLGKTSFSLLLHVECLTVWKIICMKVSMAK